MFKKRYFFQFFLLPISITACFATPNHGVQGNLIFLGVNHASTKSVWLSLTSAAGSFRLEAQGHQLIDAWSKDQRGLRLSISPIVSNGNGGTHHLINAANNKKLDSQNQRGGIVFPPFPSRPPGIPAHPIIYPGTPMHPIIYPGTPAHPIIYPGRPAHPIIYPGTPAHPIIYPGTPAHPIIYPGTPAHPIIYPGTPAHPIIYPGTPSHPIIYPGTPSHPIIYPGTPSHPIVYPGTPSHPIIYPGTPSHPIVYPGTPSHPIVYPGTPSHPIVYPGTPSHPIVYPGTPSRPNVFLGRSAQPIAIPGTPRLMVMPPASSSAGGKPLPEAPEETSTGATASSRLSPSSTLESYPERNLHQTAPITPAGATPSSPSEGYAEGNLNQIAPITPARQVDEEKAWNIWSDNYYLGIRDGRNNVNTQGGATNYTIGADRHITSNLVGGVSLSAIHLDTSAFNNGLVNNVRGYKVGPYFGYQISNTWAVDGLINYGQLQNRNTILSLNSHYVTKLVNATLHAIGLYQFGNFQVRPQPLITYTNYRNPTYDFNGTILNTPVQITRAAESFALGFLEFKVEGNYTKETKKGDLVQPYAELGIDYAFARPSNDQVYSGNLALAALPKVSGLVTLGLRSLMAKSLMIQASGSYLSVGQQSYDVWDARLLISYSFS